MTSFFFFYSVPPPVSVSITSNPPSPVNNMSTVTVTCAVELSSAIIESDIPLLMVDARLSRDGTMLSVTGPAVTSTTFTFTRRFETFGRSDSGNYTCTATVRPQPTSTYLTGSGILDNTINITICKLSCTPIG